MPCKSSVNDRGSDHAPMCCQTEAILPAPDQYQPGKTLDTANTDAVMRWTRTFWAMPRLTDTLQEAILVRFCTESSVCDVNNLGALEMRPGTGLSASLQEII
nr:PREDICTED: uncharacterized protein LOC107399217 [Tribolium castaneum]|eukprot:XP_015840499.1 PREDICTED: uncharacterized protein LOC107399217 [Tribolium castaneum]